MRNIAPPTKAIVPSHQKGITLLAFYGPNGNTLEVQDHIEPNTLISLINPSEEELSPEANVCREINHDDLLNLHGLETDIVYFETSLNANHVVLGRAAKARGS